MKHICYICGQSPEQGIKFYICKIAAPLQTNPRLIAVCTTHYCTSGDLMGVLNKYWTELTEDKYNCYVTFK